MPLREMYSSKPGSPLTSLVDAISADATSMTLEDASVLPSAPNICVIGSDSNAEIVSYTSISGNVVSGMVRGLGDTTRSAWAANTSVARNITSYDHDTFIYNINELQTDIDTLSDEVDGKQDTLPAYDTTPTANSTNIVTSGGVKTALDAKANLSNEVLYFTGKATSVTSSSAVFCTVSDSRITAKHVVTEIYYSNSSAVTSNVSWSTSASTLTLTGINTNASNTVNVTLALAGNL